MDRLSQLPEDIIWHILYYLSNQELVRLGLASKEFLNLVRKRPALVFEHQPVVSGDKLTARFVAEALYIFHSLKRYQKKSIHLETFAFQPPILVEWTHSKHHFYDDDDENDDDRDKFQGFYNLIIKLAIEKGLINLSLSMASYYIIPEPVFEVESLVDLSLRFGVLEPKRSVVWPNLKRLFLKLVSFEKGVLEIMMRGCPLIEILEIKKCCVKNMDGISFKVSDLGSLKELDIELLPKQTLEVSQVPNLNSICCREVNSTSRSLLNLSSHEYQNLRNLSVAGIRTNDDIFTNFSRKFPRLEYLSIERIQTMENLVISSPSLKVIVIRDDNISLQEGWFHVPNLVLFDYHTSFISGLPRLSFIGNSGGWKSRVKLSEYLTIRLDSPWFLKLHNLLAALEKSEISVTAEFVKKNVELCEAIAHSAPRIIPNVSEFCILTNWMVLDITSAHSILTGIFMICRPERIIFRPLRPQNDRVCRQHNVKYLCDATDDSSNCNKFVELLEAQNKEKEISTMIFNMEYIRGSCPEMPRDAKRLKIN